MEYFTNALKQYAQFAGRCRRKDYWMFVLFYLIFYIGLSIIDKIIGMRLFTTLYALALLVPNLSIVARRLHDTGRTGWWQLIALVPLVGIIVLIVFLVQESQGDNQYGPAPSEV